MRVLSVDTTSAFGSLALMEDDHVVEEVPLHSPDGFSQVLFDHIARLLARHDWKTDSVNCFAAAAGPGSFTGVRIGLTAVKGLAEATGGCAFAVSNLQALAACGSTPVRAVVMDARRGDVYGAVYGADGSVLQAETVVPFRQWLEILPNDITEVLSPDFGPFRPHFDRDVPIVEERSLAPAIARIAIGLKRAGATGDPAAIDANYVRRSDAELNWTDR